MRVLNFEVLRREQQRALDTARIHVTAQARWLGTWVSKKIQMLKAGDWGINGERSTVNAKFCIVLVIHKIQADTRDLIKLPLIFFFLNMEIKYWDTWGTLSQLKMSTRDLSNIYGQLNSSGKKDDLSFTFKLESIRLYLPSVLKYVTWGLVLLGLNISGPWYHNWKQKLIKLTQLCLSSRGT